MVLKQITAYSVISSLILTVFLNVCVGKAFTEEAVHGAAQVVQERLWSSKSPTRLWHVFRLFC